MRCKFCNKKKSILIECKYCKSKLCSKCITLEIHNCIKIEDCKKRKRDELKDRLDIEKSEQNKIIKI